MIPLSAEARPAWLLGGIGITRFKLKKQQQNSGFPPPKATRASENAQPNHLRRDPKKKTPH